MDAELDIRLSVGRPIHLVDYLTGALLLIAGFIDLIPSKAILVFIMLFQQI